MLDTIPALGSPWPYGMRLTHGEWVLPLIAYPLSGRVGQSNRAGAAQSERFW